MILSLFDNAIISKFFTILVTSITVMTAATGCTIPGVGTIGGGPSSLYGVLKNDPNNTDISGGTYLRANAVQIGPTTDSKDVNGTALASLSIRKLQQVDKDTLYALTVEKGLFLSSNGGVTWKRKYIYNINSNKSTPEEKTADTNAKIQQNDQFNIVDFAFDVASPKTIYIAGKDITKVGKIFKSIDYGDNFAPTYTEVEPNISVNRLTIDPLNPNRVYAILEKGAIIRSLDGGSNWQKIYGLIDPPVSIGFVVSSNNLLYALTDKSLLTSPDDGTTWTNTPLKKRPKAANSVNSVSNNNNYFNGGSQDMLSSITKIVFVQNGDYDTLKTRQDRGINTLEVFVIAEQQLWYTDNLASGLAPVNLPLQNTQNNLLDIAYDPKIGTNKLMLSVDNKLLISGNKGQSWAISDNIRTQEKIGSIYQIVIDRQNPEINYLGLASLKK